MVDYQKSIEKVTRLFSKGKSEKALKLARQMSDEFVQSGAYLQAVALWKAVIKAEECLVEAHLRLIVLQQQLQLTQDAEVQQRVLEDVCRREEITPEELDRIRKECGLQARKEAAEAKEN
jgi:cytidylate kinase